MVEMFSKIFGSWNESFLSLLQFFSENFSSHRADIGGWFRNVR